MFFIRNRKWKTTVYIIFMLKDIHYSKDFNTILKMEEKTENAYL